MVVVSCFLILVAKLLQQLRSFFLSDEEKNLRSLTDCRLELKACIEHLNCQPILLRLAWSDAATYDKSFKSWPLCGGANGNVRFDDELCYKNNAGLSKAIDILRPFKTKYRRVSWADLIQMGGALAVELTGGPHVKMKYGRQDISISQYAAIFPKRNKSRVALNVLDDNNSNNNNNSYHNIKYRQATNSNRPIQQPSHKSEHSRNLLALRLPCPLPPYPDGAPSPEVHIRNIFFRMGLSNKDAVALIGAHTIGRAFKDRTGVCPYSSGDQGATAYTRPTSMAKVNEHTQCLVFNSYSYVVFYLTIISF